MMKYYSKDVIIITLFMWTRHNGIGGEVSEVWEEGTRIENYAYMAVSHWLEE